MRRGNVKTTVSTEPAVTYMHISPATFIIKVKEAAHMLPAKPCCHTHYNALVIPDAMILLYFSNKDACSREGLLINYSLGLSPDILQIK